MRELFRKALVLFALALLLPFGQALAYTQLNPVYDFSAPTTPGNLTAVARSGTQIDLSWTASTDPDNATLNYFIHQGEQEFGPTSNTTYSVTGLLPNNTYYFTVTACDAASNCSADSNQVQAATLNDTTAPTTPSNFTGRAVSASQADLSWTASSDVDSPNITYHITDGYGITVYGATTSTVFSVKNLSSSVTYTFNVYATDPRGNYSNTASATVAMPAVDSTAPAVSITAPQDNAAVSGVATVSASATDANGVAGVQFFLDNVPVGSEVVAAPYSTTIDFINTPVGQHIIAAQARDASSNTGVAQITVNVAAPASPVPSNVQVSQVTATSAVVSWDTSSFIGGTVLYGPDANYGSLVTSSVKAQHQSVTLTNLQSGTTYHYSVKVSVPDLPSSFSPDATFTTLANNQQQLAADTTKPQAYFSSLAAAATSTGGVVTITISATDPSVAGQTASGIAGVQIKVDGADLGSELRTAPYSLAWDTTNVQNGSHVITAVVRDNAGNTVTITASVTISNAGQNLTQSVNTGTTLNVPGLPAHPNGTLILDGSTIYLIKNGQKAGFRDPEEYKSHGYKFTQAVSASAADLALPSQTIIKALEGTLVLDKSDNRTVYMVGSDGTKRGFASEQVFKSLGYKFLDLAKINMSDYPAGPAISTSTEAHPDGALVLEGKTVWWIKGATRQGFESADVFNTYGFSFSKLVPANAADLALPEGPLVKFRDGTLVKDGSTYYIISDGRKLKFTTSDQMTSKGYKTANIIPASLANYDYGGDLE